jgi:hypothetical protein
LRKEFARKCILYSSWIFLYSLHSWAFPLRFPKEYAGFSLPGKIWFQLNYKLWGYDFISHVGYINRFSWSIFILPHCIIIFGIITYTYLTRPKAKEQFN